MAHARADPIPQNGITCIPFTFTRYHEPPYDEPAGSTYLVAQPPPMTFDFLSLACASRSPTQANHHPELTCVHLLPRSGSSLS